MVIPKDSARLQASTEDSATLFKKKKSPPKGHLPGNCLLNLRLILFTVTKDYCFKTSDAILLIFFSV
jgi:alkylated DNA repair dioxygenase AlkB